MSEIGWLFGWAKQNGIEIHKDKYGQADILDLLEKYREWQKKQGVRKPSESDRAMQALDAVEAQRRKTNASKEDIFEKKDEIIGLEFDWDGEKEE